MICKILVILILSVLCGITYRLGGIGKPWNTKYRDFGCPVIVTFAMTLMFGWNYWLILSGFLLFGALTTYWDDFSRNFENQDLWCWIFVGLGYSLAVLPWVISTGNYIGFVIRAVVLTALTTIWSLNVDSDVWEEFGRGSLLVATLPLLTIGG